MTNTRVTIPFQEYNPLMIKEVVSSVGCSSAKAWGFPREVTYEELISGRWFMDTEKKIVVGWFEETPLPRTLGVHLAVNPGVRGNWDFQGYWASLRGAAVEVLDGPGALVVVPPYGVIEPYLEWLGFSQAAEGDFMVRQVGEQYG